MSIPIYTRNQPQVATYWPPGNNDGLGKLTYEGSELVRCRWQDVAELFRDYQGREVTSSAVVYCGIDVQVGGFLALGEFDYALTPTQAGAHEIRQVQRSPHLHGTTQLIKAML